MMAKVTRRRVTDTLRRAGFTPAKWQGRGTARCLTEPGYIAEEKGGAVHLCACAMPREGQGIQEKRAAERAMLEEMRQGFLGTRLRAQWNPEVKVGLIVTAIDPFEWDQQEGSLSR